jgi:hypothetical protein
MAKRYFKKALLSQNVFKDRNGRPINWEKLGGNTGVIALDEEVPDQALLIEDLKKVAGRLGVSETNELGYQTLKKNRQGRRFAPKLSASGGPVRIVSRDLKLQKRVVAPSVADAAAPPQLSDAPPQPDTKPEGGDQSLAKAMVPPPRKVGRPRKAQQTDQHQRSELVVIGGGQAAAA